MERVRFARFSDGDRGIMLVFAPLLIARARGWFEAEGVELELVTPRERYGWLELVHGRADLGAGYISFPADPRYRGTMVAVAAHEEHRPGCGFTSLMAPPALIASGALSDYRSLKGKRIGLLPGRGDDYMAFHHALAQGGLTMADVTAVPTPHGGPERTRQIEAGEVDLVIARRPCDQLQWENEGLLRHWKRGHEVAPLVQPQFLLANAAFVRARPEAGARFFAAWLRGARAYVEAMVEGRDRQAMIDLLVAESDDSRETVAAMYPVYYPPTGRIDRAGLRRDTAVLAGAGLFPADVAVDELIDDTLIEGALARLATSPLEAVA
jgi:ABC-type nitrate/sulfonate/bicarbonate transport system substrate-binding protein